MTTMDPHYIDALALVLLVSALLSGGLIWLLQPMWQHYALAKPNLRSSHKDPTPQGGGIVVIAVTIAVGALATTFVPVLSETVAELAPVLAAATLLAIVGTVDDVYIVEIGPRLFLQTVAVIAVVAALPNELRVLPALPWGLERLTLVICGIWFVNLVNFMDGIDWMTVAETVPVTAGLALFGLMGALPPYATVVSVALCGAMIGFAPFNRPVARLFLGDVGSLPIGLLLGWLLTELAGRGHLVAALLLPLYYLADTAITILRRLANGEQITQAHKSHFYQRALGKGFNIYLIVSCVFLLNIVLAALAAVTVVHTSPGTHIAALSIGGILVAVLLAIFNSPQSPSR